MGGSQLATKGEIKMVKKTNQPEEESNLEKNNWIINIKIESGMTTDEDDEDNTNC